MAAWGIGLVAEDPRGAGRRAEGLFMLAQRQLPRDTGTMWPCSLRIVGLQLGDVSQQFLFAGHAAEVEAEHLESSLGRFATGPKTD